MACTASSLSVSSEGRRHLSQHRPPDHVSPLSRPDHQDPVSGRLSTTTSRRALIDSSRFPVAFRPPAFASRSSFSRRGDRASLTVGPPANPNRRAGPRRGFHVPHARATTGEGALYIPGTTVLTPGHDHQPAPAASQRQVPAPRHNIHLCGAPPDEASTEGLSNSPVRSSPRLWPPDGTGALGLFPELRTPPLRATHVGAGTGHRARTRNNALRHRPSLQPRGFTRYVRPRVALVDAEASDGLATSWRRFETRTWTALDPRRRGR